MYRSTQIQDACKRRVAGTVFGTQDAVNMAFTEKEKDGYLTLNYN